jgi:hypothetical protein
MELPKVLIDLVAAQASYNSVAYAKCFTETAVVYDEGKMHNGRKEIEKWISDANKNYKSIMKPISFEKNEDQSILKAEVSGNFPGSPIVLSYRLNIIGNQIQFLKITG